VRHTNDAATLQPDNVRAREPDFSYQRLGDSYSQVALMARQIPPLRSHCCSTETTDGIAYSPQPTSPTASNNDPEITRAIVLIIGASPKERIE
jgi:hypothetical protein